MLPQVVTYLPGLRPLSTMELYTDTYYIQRIQAGDVACFACLLDKYSRPINSLILKVVQNQEEAEELAQDTFMKVFKNLASFKGDCSFSTWIYRIAYNTAVSETRRRKREWACIDQARLANLPDSEAERMDAWEGRQEYLDALARAVGELEPEERALVTLFYYEEYSVSECAGITQMSESNIKVRLHRIRKKLYILVNTQLHGSEK